MIDSLFELPTHREEGEHDYYPTPLWFAERIVERYFPHLGTNDHVLEPTCGNGHFLDVLPSGIRATGIELQAELADEARAKGHRVITGDILTAPLPADLTAAIGNPPFHSETIHRILERLGSILEPTRSAGFILPTYFFQKSRQVERLRDTYSIGVDLIPRDVYPELSKPICFAMFTRSHERALWGLALFDEVNDVLSMHARTRKTLGTAPTTWRAVVTDTLDRLGGTATLQQIYAAIEPARPSGNPWWREKVRQTLNRAHVRVAPNTYALAA